MKNPRVFGDFPSNGVVRLWASANSDSHSSCDRDREGYGHSNIHADPDHYTDPYRHHHRIQRKGMGRTTFRKMWML